MELMRICLQFVIDSLEINEIPNDRLYILNKKTSKTFKFIFFSPKKFIRFNEKFKISIIVVVVVVVVAIVVA